MYSVARASEAKVRMLNMKGNLALELSNARANEIVFRR